MTFFCHPPIAAGKLVTTFNIYIYIYLYDMGRKRTIVDHSQEEDALANIGVEMRDRNVAKKHFSIHRLENI